MNKLIIAIIPFNGSFEITSYCPDKDEAAQTLYTMPTMEEAKTLQASLIANHNESEAINPSAHPRTAQAPGAMPYSEYETVYKALLIDFLKLSERKFGGSLIASAESSVAVELLVDLEEAYPHHCAKYEEQFLVTITYS